MVFYTDILPEKYRPQIRMMLQKYGEEFIPPLSVRSGTIQQSFKESCYRKSKDYYSNMIEQAFIVDAEEGRIRGFLYYATYTDHNSNTFDGCVVRWNEIVSQ